MGQYIKLVHDLVLKKMENEELNFESKEALTSVFKEYEIHTKIIVEQLELCKKDHAELRLEMNRLVNENRELYEKLKNASESSLYRTPLPAIESSEAIENLQQQLALALEEKDTLEGLWRSSVQETDALKEKLQELQSGKQLTLTQNKLNDVQKDYTEAIQILENKLSVFKTENDQLHVKGQFLEDQLKKVNSQLAVVNEQNLTLNHSLKETTEREQELKSKYLSLEAKFIELDRAYQADKVKYAQIHEYEKVESSLKGKLESTVKQRDDLQVALERSHERTAEMLRSTAADRARIQEAVALVEGASRDRDEALAREIIATEETKKLKAELERLVDEAGRKVVEEETKLKKQYESQLASVKEQFQIVEQDRNRKRVEVEQLQKECERLQTLVTQSQESAATDKRDKELDKVHKEIQLYEIECDQLKIENETLREAVDKLEERCRRHSHHKKKMINDIQRMRKDLQTSQHDLAMSEQRGDLLNSQLQATSLDLAQLQSQTILQRDSGSAVEPNVSLTSTLNLYKRLNESYGQMNDKWKNEMTELTNKFEAKLRKFKKQKQVRFSKEDQQPK